MPLMPVIAGQGWRVYRAAMPVLFRLLTLLALVLMPLGMGAVPAGAAPHPATGTAMAAEHCPEVPGSQPAHPDAGDCAMACAAALPALAPRAAQRVALLNPPTPRIFADVLTGIYPETATPPPRVF